jgi:transitional endoplasmic reticulum ATPase
LEILKIHSIKMPLTEEAKAFLDHIAQHTDGYSGADLENICREAGMIAIRRQGKDIEGIEKMDFETAFKESTPSLTAEFIKSYEKIAKKMKRRDAKLDLGYLS